MVEQLTHFRPHARFRDVPSCGMAMRQSDCSATTGDLASFPNFAVFAPDGTMYVTDIQQALIWRVPRGGGRPGYPAGPAGAALR